MRDALRLHDLQPGPRLDLAVELVEAGRGFVFEEVSISGDGHHLHVEVIAPYTGQPLTDAEALALLNHGGAILERLQVADVRFARLAASLPPRFSVIEDYGMGTITLCELDHGTLKWR